MQFLAPFALVALLPLAGIIILLYLLKLRRRELVIPSTFLWHRAVQDIQANTPFQKLRRNLLLLLQLLALAALVGALAGPFLWAARLAGKSTVLVIDTSASMRATDAQGSRFAEAIGRAREIAATMGRGDEAAVVVGAGRAWVALPFSKDKSRLLTVLDGISPTDCTTNVRDALLLAASLAGTRPQAQILIFSDGAFPPLPELASPAAVQFVKVGKRNDNVALLAFEAARVPASREHQLFLRMKNYAAHTKKCVLSIYQDDELLDAQELDLAPQANHVETYTATLTQAGLLRAELEVDDDLSADNVAYAFAQPPSARSVLLVTPGNLFLEQVLLVLPDVDVYTTAALSAEETASAYEKYDLVIFDRIAPAVGPSRGAVMIIAAGGYGGSAWRWARSCLHRPSHAGTPSTRCSGMSTWAAFRSARLEP